MKILKIKNKNLKKLIEELSEKLKNGEIIVFPTDTVYGLLADAKNKKAVEKVFKIKKRKKGKALPIFVKDIEMAKKFAFINKSQERFLKKFWPGKVTFILKRKKAKIYGVKKETIALRIPKYRLINLLLKKLNFPLTGTSANISGTPPSTKIKEVLNQFKNKKFQPDLILDAGNLKFSLPSTIIDLTKGKPKILRKGEINLP